MRISPVAQNPWFLMKKMMILLPAAGKRIDRKTAFCLLRFFWLTPYCADSSKRIHFDPSFGPSLGKTNDFAFATFIPFTFFASGPCARHFGKLTSGKSASCPRKTLLFSIFVERISQKPPSAASKVPRLLV